MQEMELLNEITICSEKLCFDCELSIDYGNGVIAVELDPFILRFQCGTQVSKAYSCGFSITSCIAIIEDAWVVLLVIILHN